MLISFGGKGAKLDGRCGVFLTCSPGPGTTGNEQTVSPGKIITLASGIVLRMMMLLMQWIKKEEEIFRVRFHIS